MQQRVEIIPKKKTGVMEKKQDKQEGTKTKIGRNERKDMKSGKKINEGEKQEGVKKLRQ